MCSLAYAQVIRILFDHTDGSVEQRHYSKRTHSIVREHIL